MDMRSAFAKDLVMFSQKNIGTLLHIYESRLNIQEIFRANLAMHIAMTKADMIIEYLYYSVLIERTGSRYTVYFVERDGYSSFDTETSAFDFGKSLDAKSALSRLKGLYNWLCTTRPSSMYHDTVKINAFVKALKANEKLKRRLEAITV